jgi:hypothetical protein
MVVDLWRLVRRGSENASSEDQPVEFRKAVDKYRKLDLSVNRFLQFRFAYSRYPVETAGALSNPGPARFSTFQEIEMFEATAGTPKANGR